MRDFRLAPRYDDPAPRFGEANGYWTLVPKKNAQENSEEENENKDSSCIRNANIGINEYEHINILIEKSISKQLDPFKSSLEVLPRILRIMECSPGQTEDSAGTQVVSKTVGENSGACRVERYWDDADDALKAEFGKLIEKKGLSVSKAWYDTSETAKIFGKKNAQVICKWCREKRIQCRPNEWKSRGKHKEWEISFKGIFFRMYKGLLPVGTETD